MQTLSAKIVGGIVGAFMLCVLCIGGVTALSGGNPSTGLAFAKGGFHFVGWGVGGTVNGARYVGVGMDEMNGAAEKDPDLNPPAPKATPKADTKAKAK